MRVLVTNDDGVYAPGLAAVTRALARWASDGHDVVVVAPLENHSGAATAVGTVYEREAIRYKRVRVPGAHDVPAYGVNASPALAVIAGALGGFGPRPDVVVSGINLGTNVGRSVLYSGTIGATLAGAQLGLSGLAVSLRSGPPPEQWSTASDLALAILPALEAAPSGTVLSLNVPALPIDQLRGIRRARISAAGMVERVSSAALGVLGGPPGNGTLDEGEVHLVFGSAIPSPGHPELDVAETAPGPLDDGTLIGAGFATLTPIVGVHEDTGQDTAEVVHTALSSADGLLTR